MKAAWWKISNKSWLKLCMSALTAAWLSTASSQHIDTYTPIHQDTFHTISLKPKVLLQYKHGMYEKQPTTIEQYSISALPFFCKTEHLWSKNSGINVRMRLGSLDYVNSLESK